jgi:hypothetical protein
MIKQNWVLGLIFIVGLIVINFNKILPIIKSLMKKRNTNEPVLDKIEELKLRKSSLLPSIFTNIEDLVEELENKGFVKSSVEAKALLKTVINEYPEI